MARGGATASHKHSKSQRISSGEKSKQHFLTWKGGDFRNYKSGEKRQGSEKITFHFKRAGRRKGERGGGMTIQFHTEGLSLPPSNVKGKKGPKSENGFFYFQVSPSPVAPSQLG